MASTMTTWTAAFVPTTLAFLASPWTAAHAISPPDWTPALKQAVDEQGLKISERDVAPIAELGSNCAWMVQSILNYAVIFEEDRNFYVTDEWTPRGLAELSSEAVDWPQGTIHETLGWCPDSDGPGCAKVAAAFRIGSTAELPGGLEAQCATVVGEHIVMLSYLLPAAVLTKSPDVARGAVSSASAAIQTMEQRKHLIEVRAQALPLPYHPPTPGPPNNEMEAVQGAGEGTGAAAPTQPVAPQSQTRAKRRVAPRYPEEARERQLGDQVCTANIRIDERGVPTEVTVEGCPQEFVSPTETAVMQWRFYPTKHNGRAVPATFTATVKFIQR